MVRCRGCGAEILWLRMESGAHAPFDAEPSPEGTWAVVQGKAVHVEPEGMLFAPSRLYVSHFATCPEGDRFRRRSSA